MKLSLDAIVDLFCDRGDPLDDYGDCFYCHNDQPDRSAQHTDECPWIKAKLQLKDVTQYDTSAATGLEIIVSDLRRKYHHLVTGGQLKPHDLSYSIEVLERLVTQLRSTGR